MTIELAQFAVALAFALALVQGLAVPAGRLAGDPRIEALARPAAVLQAVLLLGAFAILINAFLASDFSVALFADHSHPAKPWLYKLAGTWGNHEGSMLLWSVILAGFGFALALSDAARAPIGRTGLALQGAIGAAFLAYLLFASNPFERLLPPPPTGAGLNPVLQHPALALHPPFLYLGYVGFSATFALAAAGLVEGRIDRHWAALVRPWALVAWSSLTIGIVLGSWWAYHELGWGGWWFWDPVENASLMPWLAGTALVHSLIVLERRGTLRAWTVLLALLAFTMSLAGTFLVRSGVLSSVHSFASDPTRGVVLLVLLVAVVGGGLALFAARADTLRPRGGGDFRPASREGMIVVNNLFLCVVLATVCLGTLYPLVLEALTGRRIAVGAPYFDATAVPLALPLVALMGVGPLLAWKRGDLLSALRRLTVAMVAAALVMAAALLRDPGAPLLAVAGLALGGWVIVATFVGWAERVRLGSGGVGDLWRRARFLPATDYGMRLAHIGFAVVVMGIAGTTAGEREALAMLAPGDSLTIEDTTLTLQAVEAARGPNYAATVARIEAVRPDVPALLLTPSKRRYLVEGQETTEAAIVQRGMGNLFVTLGSPGDGGRWGVRAVIKPLIELLWIGAGLMAAGGFLSAFARRPQVARAERPARDAALAPALSER